MESEIIDSCYSLLISHLRYNFECVFSSKKFNPENWLISAWANKTSYSSVPKLGIVNDNSNFHSKRKANNTRKPGLKGMKRKKVNLLCLKKTGDKNYFSS